MKANKIVYTSNTGFTERYARMLAEETGLPCYCLEESPRGGSAIYLGWLMAGTVSITLGCTSFIVGRMLRSWA